MNQRYQAMRAVLNKELHVICCKGKFETLPDEVRHRGPWQVLSRGEIEDDPHTNRRMPKAIDRPLGLKNWR